MHKLSCLGHLRILQICILLAAITSTGCMTGTYIAGSSMALPQAAALQPDEPLHLQLKLEIYVGSEVYSVEHKWHCDHQRHFSMGDGKWHLRYSLSETRFVRRIDNENAVFVRLPNCPGGTGRSINAHPDLEVMLIKTADDPAIAVEVKNDASLHGTMYPRVKHVEVTYAAAQAMDTRHSPEELQLLNQLAAFRYERIYGRLFQRTDWERSNTLRGTLHGLNAIAVASPSKLFLGISEFDGFSEYCSQQCKSQYVSFKFDGSAWVIDEIEPYHRVRIYRRAAPQTKALLPKSPFVVEYKGVRTGTLERSQQIYDPNNGWLIDVRTTSFLF
jgi:hypothetical protein